MSVSRIKENRVKGCFTAEKRNCYLINRRLQLNSALVTGGVVLAVSIFFGLLLAGTYLYFSESAELLMAEVGIGRLVPSISSSQVSNFLSASGKAHSIAVSDAKVILLRAVVIGLALGLGAGYLEICRTHRIAGPAHRVCKYLQLASKGDYTVRIEARKNDHFGDMTESFNQLMSQLEERGKSVGKVASSTEK